MAHFKQSDDSLLADTWSIQGTATTLVETRRWARLMAWWHRLASPPEPDKDAIIRKREAYRRARSVSTVIFYFLPAMVMVFPSSLFMPNVYVRYVVIAMMAACICSLLFNRAGHTNIAGMFLAGSFEVAITTVILTTTPLNPTGLQLYDLYILVELLAIAVLPVRAVWAIAFVDSVFVSIDLFCQPRTLDFTRLLAEQSYFSIVTRPIALMIIVASGTSLWLHSISKATRQSYQAEFVANLEHAAAEQSAVEAEAKQILEESIQQFVRAHTLLANGQSIERIAYPPARILWPLVGIVNNLWARLQRSQQRENEYTQLQHELMVYNEFLQRAKLVPGQPLPVYKSKTMLAPLALSTTKLHEETLRYGAQVRRRTNSYHLDEKN